jgi:hypothetical protein
VQPDPAHPDHLVLDMAERPWWVHASERREAERARVRVPWLAAALSDAGNGGSSTASTPFGSGAAGSSAERRPDRATY